MEQESDGKTPSFSRGMSGPFGPYTEPVKTFLDEHTHAMWLRLCNDKETTSSELIRDLLYLCLHERTPGEFTAEDRRALVESKGLNAVLIPLRVMDGARRTARA